VKLRPELMPPVLDEAKVRRLAKLASKLNGAKPGGTDPSVWGADLAKFNRLAGTQFRIEDFQGIYGGLEHDTWVRRVLIGKAVRPVADITHEELAEVVRRAMPGDGDLDECDAYMAIFDANVPLEGASNLIFYPLDYDASTNTWGDGRPIGEYDPSPEQIVEWALTQQRR
jgi:hypothetical protein